MDKESFAAFIAERRKEMNLTQKDLADRLLISDKAVSKWERGISFPDITLLEPLSEALSVSVIELMEGRRINMDEKIVASDIEKTVHETLNMESEEKKTDRKMRFGERLIATISFTFLAALECVCLCLNFEIERLSLHLFTVEGLAVFFGIYYWLFSREVLPSFYDENKVSLYSDGFMRMNMPGVHFNNSNWKHILNGCRIWTAVTAVLYPVLTFFEEMFFPLEGLWIMLMIFPVVFSLFVPVYVLARKYE